MYGAALSGPSAGLHSPGERHPGAIAAASARRIPAGRRALGPAEHRGARPERSFLGVDRAVGRGVQQSRPLHRAGRASALHAHSVALRQAPDSGARLCSGRTRPTRFAGTGRRCGRPDSCSSWPTGSNSPNANRAFPVARSRPGTARICTLLGRRSRTPRCWRTRIPPSLAPHVLLRTRRA